jgi:hypothetical protein
LHLQQQQHHHQQQQQHCNFDAKKDVIIKNNEIGKLLCLVIKKVFYCVIASYLIFAKIILKFASHKLLKTYAM